MIGMTFSCDGTHDIDHKTFFERLDAFAAPGCDGAGPTADYAWYPASWLISHNGIWVSVCISHRQRAITAANGKSASGA